jgi:hypothetical protein
VTANAPTSPAILLLVDAPDLTAADGANAISVSGSRWMLPEVNGSGLLVS